MRLVALALAASSLALAGCGEKEAAGNTAAVDQAVTAEDFATNDATAIDAATGADANMAADVDINFIANDSDTNGTAPSVGRSASSSRSRPSGTNVAAPADEPQPPAAEPAATQPPEINAN